MKKETLLSTFSILPNPVAANTVVAIAAKGLKEGVYRLTISDSAGQEAQTGEVVIGKRSKTPFLQTGDLAPGPYFIRLTHRQTGRSYTEIMIVD